METVQLEGYKSSFLIDLINRDKFFYIEITQTINSENSTVQSIKINSLILSDFIKAIQNYYAKIPNSNKNLRNHITEKDQDKIVERYLRGVTVKDLIIQFDQSKDLIEMILRNKNIAIIPPQKLRNYNWYKGIRKRIK